MVTEGVACVVAIAMESLKQLLSCTRLGTQGITSPLHELFQTETKQKGHREKDTVQCSIR